LRLFAAQYLVDIFHSYPQADFRVPHGQRQSPNRVARLRR
jgi:hypothetical protein